MTPFARTLRQPIAWVFAFATAIVGAMGPGDLIGYAALHALGPSAPLGPATAHAAEFFRALRPYGDATSLVGRWAVLATLTWLLRAPLVAATFGGAPFALLSKGFGRFLRTRGVSIMVTGAFAFLPLSGLVGWAKKDPESPLPWVGVALLLALAGGWTALADRYALRRFDAKQDAIAAQKRAEGRYAGPHYLDTSTARGGYDVATGADNAVTDAGWALLSALPVVLVAIALDVVRFAVAVVVPGIAGSVIQVVVAAVCALTTAALWTRAFERTTSP